MYGEIKRFIFLLMLLFGVLGLAWSLLTWTFQKLFWASVIALALFCFELIRGGRQNDAT